MCRRGARGVLRQCGTPSGRRASQEEGDSRVRTFCGEVPRSTRPLFSDNREQRRCGSKWRGSSQGLLAVIDEALVSPVGTSVYQVRGRSGGQFAGRVAQESDSVINVG